MEQVEELMLRHPWLTVLVVFVAPFVIVGTLE